MQNRAASFLRFQNRLNFAVFFSAYSLIHLITSVLITLARVDISHGQYKEVYPVGQQVFLSLMMKIERFLSYEGEANLNTNAY